MFKAEPRTWREYVYGLAYITRARARRKLEAADAATVPQMAEQRDRDDWLRNHRSLAGW